MKDILNVLINNKSIRILAIFIVLDVIFGFLRSIKERKTNSTIGIDGIIRKTGMLITIVVAIILDTMCKIDLIFFIPEDLKQALKINSCGITLLFNALYIIFEILSILKNMKRCGIPFPKKLNSFLEKLLKEFTQEVVDDNKEKIDNRESEAKG